MEIIYKRKNDVTQYREQHNSHPFCKENYQLKKKIQKFIRQGKPRTNPQNTTSHNHADVTQTFKSIHQSHQNQVGMSGALIGTEKKVTKSDFRNIGAPP
jgi:hypothetical protein